ncbi:MAG: peptidoglycan-binding protein, partial [Rhizobium giardinii]
MKLMKTAAIVTLLAGCAFTSFGVQGAEAYTLMDLFRRKRQPVEEMQVLPGYGGMQETRPAERPVALPRVTSPRYYTYKAEALRRIDTAKLLDPVVTGSVGSDVQPTQGASLADSRRFLPDVTAYAPSDVAKAVEAFYAGREGFIWIDANGPNAAARAALTVLGDAASVGLDPQDYAVSVPSDTFDSADTTGREKSLVDFEIRLSAATLTYVQDTVRGRIDPNKISGYHDFERKSINLKGKLENIARSHDVAAYLNSQT